MMKTWAIQWHTICSFCRNLHGDYSRTSLTLQILNYTVLQLLKPIHRCLCQTCSLGFVWSLVISIPTFLDKYLRVQGAEVIAAPESVYVPWRGSHWLGWFSLEMRCNTKNTEFVHWRADCVKNRGTVRKQLENERQTLKESFSHHKRKPVWTQMYSGKHEKHKEKVCGRAGYQELSNQSELPTFSNKASK